MTCTRAACDRPTHGKGLCHPHYRALRIATTPVEVACPCGWTGKSTYPPSDARRRVTRHQARSQCAAVEPEPTPPHVPLTDTPCAADPAIFFPEDFRGEPAEWALTTALAICSECPIREQCLAIAMHAEGSKSASARYGIFGGTTPTQRASLARSTRRKG